MDGRELRKYPVGIQSFPDIRSGGYVYIDKTEIIWRLLHSGPSAFFLSRPRRFGKSLLLSTVQAYYEGRRDLFQGLALDSLEQEWETYPVIRLDLASVKTTDAQMLDALLSRLLADQEAIYGRDENDVTPGSRLHTLIQRAHAASGKKVVVLIDEYDAPMLNVIDDPEKLELFRQVMREFYIQLKTSYDHIHLVFLTGITKFSQLSIFSELNNLVNISMNEEYAAICGITEDELQTQMVPDIERLAARLDISTEEASYLLKEHYDGYHFCDSSPDVYNPFSLLSAFYARRIDSYWYASGTPTYLMRMLRRGNLALPQLDGYRTRASAFDVAPDGGFSLLPMLYQAGYLTIKSADSRTGSYTLGIPNDEVRIGLCESLLASVGEDAGEDVLSGCYSVLDAMVGALRRGDVDAALTSLRAYLSAMPYELASKNELQFETVFYLIFSLMGIQIRTELKTSSGRIDAVVRCGGTTYVMEFKYDKTASEALAQIDEKGYALPFAGNDCRVVKVGVNYSSRQRTIDDWIIAEG